MCVIITTLYSTLIIAFSRYNCLSSHYLFGQKRRLYKVCCGPVCYARKRKQQGNNRAQVIDTQVITLSYVHNNDRWQDAENEPYDYSAVLFALVMIPWDCLGRKSLHFVVKYFGRKNEITYLYIFKEFILFVTVSIIFFSY